jgi:hypothetical protein
MGSRNWCRAEVDETTGEFLFDIRVEKEKGGGVTFGSVYQAFDLVVHF